MFRINFVSFVCKMLVLSIFLTGMLGCQSLRKKFIRQKKKDKKVDFIPVLDPIDYEPGQVSAKERYGYHYGMWKVWYRELIEDLAKKGSDKSQLFNLMKAMSQIEEMKKWVRDEKKEVLDDVMVKISEFKKTYEKPKVMRNNHSQKAMFERIAKKVRNELNPKVMGGFYLE